MNMEKRLKLLDPQFLHIEAANHGFQVNVVSEKLSKALFANQHSFDTVFMLSLIGLQEMAF